MNGFRLFKEKCQKIYGQQDYWMVPIFRSCLAFLIFFSLTRHFSSLFDFADTSGRNIDVLFLSAIPFALDCFRGHLFVLVFIAKQYQRKICHPHCLDAFLLSFENPLFFADFCRAHYGFYGLSASGFV